MEPTDPAARSRRRAVLVPALVGTLSLLAGLTLMYVSFRDPGETADVEPARAEEVRTERVVSREGGFALAVPEDMAVTERGAAVQLESEDSDLVVVVARGERAALRPANRRLLRALEQRYERMQVVATERQRVDDRPALATYGHAVNSSRVRLRFVTITVQARPRMYTIAAYTAFESDPAVVLPRVNAVANGFEVLPGAR